MLQVMVRVQPADKRDGLDTGSESPIARLVRPGGCKSAGVGRSRLRGKLAGMALAASFRARKIRRGSEQEEEERVQG